MTALVIDDDQEFIDQIVPLLKKWGYKTETADSIRQARHILEPGRKFDLVILAFYIDQMIAARIAAIIKDGNPATKVIMATYGRDRLISQAESMGVDAVIEKGWDNFEDTLARIIQQLSA